MTTESSTFVLYCDLCVLRSKEFSTTISVIAVYIIYPEHIRGLLCALEHV